MRFTALFIILFSLTIHASPVIHEIQKLQASTPQEDDEYGFTLAHSNDQLFVSAMGHAVYIYSYDRELNEYSLEQALGPSTSSADFGTSLLVIDDILYIGDSNYGSSGGKVWICRKTEGTWELEEIIPTPGVWDGLFGASVSVSGNLMLVGSPDDGEPYPVGKAYLYQKTEAEWKLIQELDGDQENGSGYGVHMFIEEERAFIADPNFSDGDNSIWAVGTIYYYSIDRTGAVPQLVFEQQIDSPEKDDNANFGDDLIVYKNDLIASGWRYSVFDVRSGAAFLYTYAEEDEQWHILSTIYNSELNEYGWLRVKHIDENIISIRANSENEFKGTVYILDKTCVSRNELLDVGTDDSCTIALLRPEEQYSNMLFGMSQVYTPTHVIAGAFGGGYGHVEGAVYVFDREDIPEYIPASPDTDEDELTDEDEETLDSDMEQTEQEQPDIEPEEPEADSNPDKDETPDEPAQIVDEDSTTPDEPVENIDEDDISNSRDDGCSCAVVF